MCYTEAARILPEGRALCVLITSKVYYMYLLCNHHFPQYTGCDTKFTTFNYSHSPHSLKFDFLLSPGGTLTKLTPLNEAQNCVCVSDVNRHTVRYRSKTKTAKGENEVPGLYHNSCMRHLKLTISINSQLRFIFFQYISALITYTVV